MADTAAEAIESSMVPLHAPDASLNTAYTQPPPPVSVYPSPTSTPCSLHAAGGERRPHAPPHLHQGSHRRPADQRQSDEERQEQSGGREEPGRGAEAQAGAVSGLKPRARHTTAARRLSS